MQSVSTGFAKHRKINYIDTMARLLSSDTREKRMTLITSLNVHEVFLQWYGITASALLSRAFMPAQPEDASKEMN